MPGDTRIPTSLVGSYAQPNWLIDRERLRERFPPRVRATELWRVDPRYLEEAQDDATLLAIRDQERAGLDIITDGEMRRESYSNRFATALDGVDIDNPGHGARSQRPSESGAARGRRRSRAAIPCRCATSSSCARIRAGRRRSPFRARSRCPSRRRTTSTSAPDELALAYARAVNDEIVDLFAAGADIVQIDEPYMQARPEQARAYGVDGAAARRSTASTGPSPSTSASATRRSFTSGRADTRSCGELASAPLRPGLDRDRPVGARSGRCWSSSPIRRSSSACSTSPPTRSRRRSRWPIGSGARFHTLRRAARRRPRLRHEVPLPAGRLRQARGAGGRRSPGGAVRRSTAPSLGPPPARLLRSARLGVRRGHRAG